MKKIYEIPLMKVAGLACCTLIAESGSNKAIDIIDAKQRGNFYDDSSEDSFWSSDIEHR